MVIGIASRSRSLDEGRGAAVTAPLWDHAAARIPFNLAILAESFNERMRDELLNENLFFSSTTPAVPSGWRGNSTTARPHSLLSFQSPAASAGALAATGSAPSVYEGFMSPQVAQPAPNGATETAEALFAVG